MTAEDQSGSPNSRGVSETDQLSADIMQDDNSACADGMAHLAVVIEADGLLHSIESLNKLGLDKDKAEQEPGDSESYPEAPDGGYAWVVCLGNFLLNMFIGGLARSEGLFFLQFQARFGVGAQLAAWPGSVVSTIGMFMGPVCGAVCSRYSVRTATIFAAVLSTAALILNGFATNIFYIFLTHGVLGGLGRGLMGPFYLLNLYFDKHRSLAAGVSSSGVGLGAIWLVPLTQMMFDVYGFTGAFLVLGGFTLNLFVCAMLYRPLSLHNKWNKGKKKKKEVPKNAEEGMALTSLSDNQDEKTNQSQPGVDDSTAENVSSQRKYRTTKPVATAADGHEGHSRNVLKDSDKRTETAETEGSALEKCSKFTKTGNAKNGTTKRSHVGTESSLSNSESSRVGGTPLTRTQTGKRHHQNCIKSSLKICFPVEHSRKDVANKVKVFHWHLLKHIPFLVFCMSSFFFVLAFKNCFTFLPAIAMSKGLSDTEAALLLTISGAVDTGARLATGFLMDFRPLRPLRPYVFNLLLFVIAGVALLIPSLESFTTYCLVSALYGLSTGAYVSQSAVVLVDLLGREVVPSSVGIQKWFQGFGTLIGPPLAGALRDALGNYDVSFYLSGASMMGAGLLMVLSNILLKLKKARETSKSS